MLALERVIGALQLLEHLLLLGLLAHHRHLGLEVRQDQGVHLGQASALDEVIQTADCGEPRQSLEKGRGEQ